jgi:hypothetical protein
MKKIGMILFLSLIAMGMGAQEIGEKQDLTIFDISYFKADLDPGVVNSVDTEISQVFINLGPVQCHRYGIPLGRRRCDGFC